MGKVFGKVMEGVIDLKTISIVSKTLYAISNCSVILANERGYVNKYLQKVEAKELNIFRKTQKILQMWQNSI